MTLSFGVTALFLSASVYSPLTTSSSNEPDWHSPLTLRETPATRHEREFPLGKSARLDERTVVEDVAIFVVRALAPKGYYGTACSSRVDFARASTNIRAVQSLDRIPCAKQGP